MYQCRICLDDDSLDNLIVPCDCKGGSQYIHRHCLDTWRTTGIIYVNGEYQNKNFYECDICKFKYEFEINNDEHEEHKRKRIYRLYVTRDIILAIGLFQFFICGIGLIAKEIDTNKELQKAFHIHNFGAYYITSLLLFFAIIGIIGCIVSMRHNNNNYMGECDTSGGDGCICIFIFCILVVICGIIIGIVAAVYYFNNICNKHMKKLWNIQETKKYIVKDRKDENNGYGEITNPLYVV
jgi:hypothetical protein